MNAVEILKDHLSMLVTLYGPLASGAGYLQGMIDARESSDNIELMPGTMSTMQPKTLSGYRYSAVRIFGEDTEAVRYLDGLIAEHGGDKAVSMGETIVAYRLGLIIAGQPAQDILGE